MNGLPAADPDRYNRPAHQDQKETMMGWIAGATKNKGGLHKSLGISQGKTIPKAKIAKAAQKGGKVGKQARLAETLEGFHHGGPKKVPSHHLDKANKQKRDMKFLMG